MASLLEEDKNPRWLTEYIDDFKKLLNDKIETDKRLKKLIEDSPGFLIYFNYLIGIIPDLVLNKVVVGEVKLKVNRLNFPKIHTKSVCFYILNEIELFKGVDSILKIYNENKKEINSSFSYLDFL